MEKIDTEQMKELLDSNEDFVLINVLDESQFEERHIPGSMNIPVEDPDFLERVTDYVPGKNQRIVVYCANEDCPASQQAAAKLENAGYTDVIDYTEGIEGWQTTGEPVENS